MVDEQPDRLPHVQRGAAAEGENRVSARGAIRLDPAQRVRVGRVWIEVAEHREGHPGLLEQGRDRFQQPRLHDALVGDEKQPAGADPLELGAERADGAAAVDDPGGKRHDGRHRGLQR